MSTASPAVGSVLPERPADVAAEAAERGARPVRAGSRVFSVDVFRGLVIAGMLLVNNLVWTPSTPAQLMHAAWGRGVTFTDMILPWFVLIIGITIPLSSSRPGALRVVRRAALLVALGIAIDSFEFRTFTAGMDVLQLLGLSYLAAALLARTPVWVRVAASAALFAGYAGLLEWGAAPGHPAGVLDPHRNVVQYLNDAHLARYNLAGVLAVGLMDYTWPDPWSRAHTQSLHATVLDPLGRAVGTVPAAWLYTGTIVAWWWAVLWVLYRRGVFIRV